MSREVTVQRTRNGWWQVVRDGAVAFSYRGEVGEYAARMHADALTGCAAILDEFIPERGPCGLCGSGADQTHRVIDSIGDWARAEMKGGDLEPWWISTEFGYPESEELVLACLEWTKPTPPKASS